MTRSLLFFSILQTLLLVVLSVSNFTLYKKINQLELSSNQENMLASQFLAASSSGVNVDTNSSTPKQLEYALINPDQLEHTIKSLLDNSLKSYLNQSTIRPHNNQSSASATASNGTVSNGIGNTGTVNKGTVSKAEMSTDEYYKLNDQVSYHIAQGSISSQDFLSLSQDMASASPQVRQQLMTRLSKELNKQ